MAARPRRDQMDPAEMETHHLWSRCVRGAFMMGIDPATGKDNSHRRGWLESLIEFQASVFAVDIGTYNIMSNHFHQVLRNRPDIARTWNAEEVVWRWKMAWPSFDKGVWHAAPTDESIQAVLLRAHEDSQLIEKIRANLCNLSWIQARIKQPIAWVCNREDDARGHMWEQRYGNRRLDDDEETLTAMLYNDLQQVKAGMVDSVAGSDHAAVQRRIRACAEDAFTDVHGREPTRHSEDLQELERLHAVFANCYLSPISHDGPLMTVQEGSVPDHELVLPNGYTFAPGPDPILKDEKTSDNKGSNQEMEHEQAGGACNHSISPAQSRTGEVHGSQINRNRGRPKKCHSYSIHRRLRNRQRRRASRNAIFSVQWEQYYDLLKQLEAQVLSQRKQQHSDFKEESSRSDGSIGPRETPSTWRGKVKSFEKWLLENAYENALIGLSVCAFRGA